MLDQVFPDAADEEAKILPSLKKIATPAQGPPDAPA
jgi:hypothetical protein